MVVGVVVADADGARVTSVSFGRSFPSVAARFAASVGGRSGYSSFGIM